MERGTEFHERALLVPLTPLSIHLTAVFMKAPEDI
jgi:hypothetical protein